MKMKMSQYVISTSTTMQREDSVIQLWLIIVRATAIDSRMALTVWIPVTHPVSGEREAACLYMALH